MLLINNKCVLHVTKQVINITNRFPLPSQHVINCNQFVMIMIARNHVYIIPILICTLTEIIKNN